MKKKGKQSKEQKKKTTIPDPLPVQEQDALKQSNLPFILLLAATIIAVLYLRIIPYWSSDVPAPVQGEVIITDPDSCYHARRILYIAQHNMRLPFYDPLVAYPNGDIPVWSPLYDWVSALPSYLISLGSPSNYLVLKTACIITVIFSLLELLAIGLLVYKSMQSKMLALLSVLLTGITEPQVMNTNIRMLDHNSILLFLFALLLYRNYILFVKEEKHALIREAVINAIIIAALFWTWPGSYIYLGAIILVQLLYIMLSRKGWLMKYFSMMYGISSILVIPLAQMHYLFAKKTMKFEYVSFFTVLFLFGCGLFFSALHCIYALRTGQSKAVNQAKLIISIIGLIIILWYIAAPLSEGIIFTEAQNKWHSTIKESGSIFYTSSVALKIFTLDNIIADFSYLVFLFPLAFVLIALRVIKISRELYSIVIVSSMVMLLLMIAQLKFSAEFSVPYGIALSLFIGACYQKLTHKTYINIFIAFVIPIILFLSPYVKLLFAHGHTPLSIDYEGFKWLKEEAHAPAMDINSSWHEISSQRESFGVLAPWHYGHYIQFYSQLPAVTDNFLIVIMINSPWQGFYDAAKFFVTEDENEAINILKKYKCKYIVVPQPYTFETFPLLLGLDPAMYVEYSASEVNGKIIIKGKAKPKFLNTLGFRLSALYGSSNPSDKELIAKVSALKHFRLIYERPGFMMDEIYVPPGKLKIYTYVDGENLTVPVSGNPAYSLEGLIITNTGNTFFYRQEGYLSEGITVPYPTKKENNYPYAKYYKVSVNGSTYEFK